MLNSWVVLGLRCRVYGLGGLLAISVLAFVRGKIGGSI